MEGWSPLAPPPEAEEKIQGAQNAQRAVLDSPASFPSTEAVSD